MRVLLVIAAVICFVCAAAQWGIGDLDTVREIAAGLAFWAGADVVVPAVTAVRER